MEIWSNVLLCGWRLSFDIFSQPSAHMYALGRSFVSPIHKSWGWKSGCIYLLEILRGYPRRSLV
jgi:hypothetical protein